MNSKMELNNLTIGLKTVKERLEIIWKLEPRSEVTDFLPMIPKYIEKESILFLGLNPSVSKLTYNGETEWEMNFNETYTNSCCKPHPHYKKFFEIKEKISEMGFINTFTYMDLLFLQCSKQKDFYPFVNDNFIKEQARLTVEIIKNIKPKLVLVCNAYADKLLRYYGESINFNPKLENDIYKLDGIPFIIEQSRYISNRRMWYSNKEKKEILYAEIKKILNKLT